VCCCRELDRQAGRQEGTEEDMLAYLQERYKWVIRAAAAAVAAV